MEKIFIVSAVIYKNNLIETENTVFVDKENANVCMSDLFKYYTSVSPENLPIYDGYIKNLYWFEIGDITENYFIRCELKQNSVN